MELIKKELLDKLAKKLVKNNGKRCIHRGIDLEKLEELTNNLSDKVEGLPYPIDKYTHVKQY